MRRRFSAIIAASAALAAACAFQGRLADSGLVDVRSLSPDIVLDIRYATADNFTKTILYPVGRCLLRRSAAQRLAAVQATLKGRGLGLKVFDCYRPLQVQRKLWELVPDPRYVADPTKGSRHNRGAAVDAALVDAAGRDLPMPTSYDDFSEIAHRDWDGAAPEEIRSRMILEDAMQGGGFIGLETEWWHFDAEDWRRYPLLDEPLAP